ncbi:hypothetical protein D3C72_1693310 [compost metagenome]
MLARQLRRCFAAALVRHVDELRSGLLLHQRGNDLVFALGAGAADLDLARVRLRAVDKLRHRLVGPGGIGPQHEFVLGNHGHRRQVAPAERQVADHRHGIERRRRDQQLVRIALRRLGVHQPLGPAGAGLVQHDDRLAHQLVPGDDALDGARHLVRRTPGAERHHDLDRLCRLPGPCIGAEAGGGAGHGRESAPDDLALHLLSPLALVL